MAKTISFEDSIKKLETIVTSLSVEDVTLEDSIKMYKEGLELVSYCNTSIDKIEKELEILSKEQV